MRIFLAFLFALVGYVVAAVAAYFLINAFSSNVHDRDLEAAMSSAFVYGPIGAILAFVLGLMRGRGSRATPS